MKSVMIEHIEVYGFKAALRSMRNAKDSWVKADSVCGIGEPGVFKFGGQLMTVPEHPIIGPNDTRLITTLIKRGSEHRKCLRYIQIWFDIVIPRYVWQEMDTYKVATVRNSCSTMHKLGSRDLTQNDFAEPIPIDFLNLLNRYGVELVAAKKEKATPKVNSLRKSYKNLLPEGYLQRATYLMNYETALIMYKQRYDHRLPEWNVEVPGSICNFIRCLPYMSAFIDAKFT